VIVEAVVEVHTLELVAHRKQAALHTGSECNPVEVAAPIVVRKAAVEVVHIEMEVAAPIAVRREIGVGAVRMEVEVVHMVMAVPNLVGLDHMTWIIPSYWVFLISHCTNRGNGQYHSTVVEANRQVTIREIYHYFRGILLVVSCA
jgi:hypothetical protein